MENNETTQVGSNSNEFDPFAKFGQAVVENTTQTNTQAQVEVKTEEVKDNSSLNTGEPPVEQKTVEKTVEAEVKTEEKPEVKTETTTETNPEETQEEFIEEDIDTNEVMSILDKTVQEEFGFASYHDAKEFKSINFEDTEEVSEWEAYEEYLMMQDPDITENEIEVLFEKYEVLFLSEDEVKERIESGEFTEKQLKALDAEFSGKLREARRFLKEKQDAIDLDSLRISKKVQSKKDDDKKAADAKLFLDTVADVLNKGVVDSFPVVDKNGNEIAKISYEVTDSDKTKILSQDLANLHTRWITNGAFDSNKFVRDMNLLVNSDKIHSSIYNQGLAAGIEKSLKDVNNIDFQGRQAAPTSDDKKSLTQIMGF